MVEEHGIVLDRWPTVYVYGCVFDVEVPFLGRRNGSGNPPRAESSHVSQRGHGQKHARSDADVGNERNVALSPAEPGISDEGNVTPLPARKRRFNVHVPAIRRFVPAVAAAEDAADIGQGAC